MNQEMYLDTGWCLYHNYKLEQPYLRICVETYGGYLFIFIKYPNYNVSYHSAQIKAFYID
jgi:hypothetical protein